MSVTTHELEVLDCDKTINKIEADIELITKIINILNFVHEPNKRRIYGTKN